MKAKHHRRLGLPAHGGSRPAETKFISLALEYRVSFLSKSPDGFLLILAYFLGQDIISRP